MTQQAPELLPCPFCGTVHVEISLGFLGDRRVQHQGGNGCDCPIDGHICLLEHWNTRTDLSPSPEAFQKMREALEICVKHGSVYGHKAAVAALKAAEGE